MERGSEEEDGNSVKSVLKVHELDVVESIRRLAAHNARAPLDTEEQVLLFLQSWWSRTYNRPLKDPLLHSYTMEELIYEF